MAYLGHWQLKAIDRRTAGLLLPQCLGSRFSAASMLSLLTVAQIEADDGNELSPQLLEDLLM